LDEHFFTLQADAGPFTTLPLGFVVYSYLCSHAVAAENMSVADAPVAPVHVVFVVIMPLLKAVAV
jgi:hypothetical protein